MGRSGGRQAGSVGSVDGVMGWLHCCLGRGQNAWNSARVEAFWPRNRACGALFLFSKQGAPGPRRVRAGVHLPENQKRSALGMLVLHGTPCTELHSEGGGSCIQEANACGAGSLPNLLASHSQSRGPRTPTFEGLARSMPPCIPYLRLPFKPLPSPVWPPGSRLAYGAPVKKRVHCK